MSKRVNNHKGWPSKNRAIARHMRNRREDNEFLKEKAMREGASFKALISAVPTNIKNYFRRKM